MPERINIPPDELRRLYWEEELTTTDIAKIYGCSPTTINTRLREYGIPLRRPGRHIEIPAEELRRLYEEGGHSAMEIARLYNCSPTTINNKLRQYGIQVRTISEATRFSVGIEIPEDELQRLYCDEELSTFKIAELYNCSSGTIRNRLHEYGIPVRSMSEAILADRGANLSCEELRQLYAGERLSTYKIAAQYRYSPTTIYAWLLRCGIRPRSWRETVELHPKYDFDGGPVKKAYLIGFRIGDLTVSVYGPEGETVRVACKSTKQEQLDLIRELFQPYGGIWEGKKDERGGRQIVAYLNRSFEFLLPKRDRIEPWILADDQCFAAFWAGYVDAEGCFAIVDRKRPRARFTVASYDKVILHQAWAKLVDMSLDFPRPKLKRPKGTPDKNGIINREDVWELRTGKKATILQLCDLLDPYLKHAKRRQDMERARQNVIERDRKAIRRHLQRTPILNDDLA